MSGFVGGAGGVPVTVALTESQFDELVAWLDDADETAGILLYRVTEVPGDAAVTITVREVRRIGPEHYRERGREGLMIESTGWMPGLAAADRQGDLFGFAHTHPGPAAEPWASDRDHEVDAALRGAADARLPDGRYLSLVIAGTPTNPQITGAFHSTDGSRPITRVRIAGDRLRLLRAPVAEEEPAPDEDTSTETAAGHPGIFDRQVRAFGRDGQALLEELRVAVVGAGGTGSAVAVLLARLGVGHLILADPQALEDTNVPRVHGSTLGDVGRRKVDVLADHVRGLGLGTHVTVVRGDVLDQCTMQALLHADVVFGCTDDHAGRGRLSRLPNRMINLLVDIGVLIDGRGDVVLNVITRLTSVQPGGACLFCTDDVDRALVVAQEMTGAQRQRLAEEGYAPGLGDPDPAVVAFTTNVASAAVTELLDRLIGWTDYDEYTPRPNRVRHRLGSHRTITETIAPASPSHWCTSPDHAGVGGGEPLLGLEWREPPAGRPE
jgi:hypothetical protein